jgi:hypothetical protein
MKLNGNSVDPFISLSEGHQSLNRSSWLFLPKPSGPGYRGTYSDSLWVGRSGDRIPVGGYSAPIQTGHVAYPVSCSLQWVSAHSPGGKAAGA